MTRDEALRYRAQVELGAAALPDQEASVEPSLTRPMRYDGSLIEHGTRINWYGMLKRAAVDLWDTEENNPESAPELWEDVLYRAGIRVIQDVITAGLAFSEGELGWWGDVIKESILPGERTNTWTPDEYPEAWRDYVAEGEPGEVTEDE